ncbi:MAG: lactate dehydrogenase [Lachnospiraceae bacterium]
MSTIMNLGNNSLPFQCSYPNPPWLKTTDSPQKRIHLLALGDVGSTVLIGLKLLGSQDIESIGIYDISPEACQRMEMELNQISLPFDFSSFPSIYILKEEALFDCDLFLFCASASVPKLGSTTKDVRMAQFDVNRKIVAHYAQLADQQHYKGLFCVISDPVDPLCREVLQHSNLSQEQIQGYGLGVMNARAAYFAKKDPRFASFLTQGRAFGPHGLDLIIADSITDYNPILSAELTEQTIHSNLVTRSLGFKPYIAPALSSAALSILLTIRGDWHYSSNCIRGVFLGSKNRTTSEGLNWEVLELPDPLFQKIQTAYTHLEEIQ